MEHGGFAGVQGGATPAGVWGGMPALTCEAESGLRMSKPSRDCAGVGGVCDCTLEDVDSRGQLVLGATVEAIGASCKRCTNHFRNHGGQIYI